MSKKSGLGKVLFGIGTGIGLGMLFAPDKGEKTREKLKIKIDELIAKAKEIDVDEVKEEISEKIDEIKEELQDLDKEKALKIAEKKSKEILAKLDDLSQIAKEKATPIIEDAIDDLRASAILVTKQVLKKLETNQKETK